MMRFFGKRSQYEDAGSSKDDTAQASSSTKSTSHRDPPETTKTVETWSAAVSEKTRLRNFVGEPYNNDYGTRLKTVIIK